MVLGRWGAPLQAGIGEGPLPSELRLSKQDITRGGGGGILPEGINLFPLESRRVPIERTE